MAKNKKNNKSKGSIRPPTKNTGRHIKSHDVLKSTSTQNMKPKFSFEFLDPDYCISKCEKDEKAALSDTLRILSSLTWGMIGQSGRHKNGYEKLDKKSLKKTPPEIVTDDNPIIAFRFCGKAPMVGFRIQETFYVVWLDRSFSLYDHG